MTDHYREAEGLLKPPVTSESERQRSDRLGRAQVHAILAAAPADDPDPHETALAQEVARAEKAERDAHAGWRLYRSTQAERNHWRAKAGEWEDRAHAAEHDRDDAAEMCTSLRRFGDSMQEQRNEAKQRAERAERERDEARQDAYRAMQDAKRLHVRVERTEAALADARAQAYDEVRDAIASIIPLGFEMRHDGTEDPRDSAYARGARDAWQEVGNLAADERHQIPEPERDLSSPLQGPDGPLGPGEVEPLRQQTPEPEAAPPQDDPGYDPAIDFGVLPSGSGQTDELEWEHRDEDGDLLSVSKCIGRIEVLITQAVGGDTAEVYLTYREATRLGRLLTAWGGES